MIDTQNKDIRGRKINKVGIREVYGEVMFKDKIIPSNFSIYVSLKEKKGIHMSRLPQTLYDNIPLKINKAVIHNFLDELEKRSGDFCEDFYIKTSFDYAKQIFSPITKIKSILLIPTKIKSEKVNSEYEDILEVTVPYTSLCPCSKEISKNSAHNQRSYAKITVILQNSNFENLIDVLVKIVERNSSSPIYNILKRPDEKFVTEKAYDNPKFVEDVCRGISEDLDKLVEKEIKDYVVVVNHEESIHQYNAVAFINMGRKLK